MRRLLAAFAILAFSTAAAPAPKPAVLTKDAPADKYFGALKMSALRMRLRIDDLADRYTRRTESDANLVHDAGDVEKSMRVWLAAYPRDVWGAPTAYHLAELYAEIQSDDARAAARSAFAYLAQTFPTSSYAHFARVRLAEGFPALHEETAVVASPAPDTAVAGSQPSAGPQASAIASAAPVTADASPAQPPDAGASLQPAR